MNQYQNQVQLGVTRNVAINEKITHDGNAL